MSAPTRTATLYRKKPVAIDADWFWTLGHIAGKALHDPTQSVEKKRHRLRAAAALLLNWDRQLVRESGSSGS